MPPATRRGKRRYSTPLWPDSSTLRALEWPAVAEAWRERCASAAAAARLDAGPVEGGAEAVRGRIAEVAEALALAGPCSPQAAPVVRLDGPPSPDLSELPDAEAAIDRAARGGDLDPTDLLAIAALARLARSTASPILLRAASFPRLAALFTDAGGDLDLPRLAALAGRIEAVLTPEGDVLDAASPELADIRRRARETRERVRRTLDRLLVKLSDHLQDRFVTEREGRSVIPVKAEVRSHVPGIVHGTSASGATAFVEPREVVRDGNELRMLDGAERREVARLLRVLSRLVEGDAETLRLAFGALTALDHRLAAARLAADLGATAPEIVDGAGYVLTAARHPLLALAGAEVVPNDIAIGPGEALAISGPNAGGKTVALKTLGLAVLMARAGLFVPAAAARVPPAGRVFCEIGDEQSLALSLSSFSAHVSHVAAVLRRTSPGDLVLVDELAGGTDPAEGATLAVAVVRALVSAGAAVAVTTHYEPLKRLHERDARVRSASMGLDPATLRPTFRLRLGEMGPSAAFGVALRYGLPDAVVDEARTLLPAAHVEAQERLERIDGLRASAERDAAAAEDARREAEAERRRLEAEIEKARSREHSSIRDEVAGLWRQIHAMREELRTARKYLRESRRPSAETVRAVEEQVDAVARKLDPAGPVERALRGDVPGTEATPGACRPGDAIYEIGRAHV